ncbi:MAG: sortase [Eubacteriaceae bacterium]|nr:sortase [Eubacteriaceae bacterium]
MRNSSRIIVIAGTLLIVLGLFLLGIMFLRADQAGRDNEDIVQKMETVITDRREGFFDPMYNAEMPSLEIGGKDFIALLEIPGYGLKLPVYSSWDKWEVTRRPCRFSGTAYNGTLIIGGYDQKGQFDFFDRIDDGTDVIITDMSGNVFTYRTYRTDRSETAEERVLAEEADMTLFVRDAQLLEYILVRCELK